MPVLSAFCVQFNFTTVEYVDFTEIMRSLGYPRLISVRYNRRFTLLVSRLILNKALWNVCLHRWRIFESQILSWLQISFTGWWNCKFCLLCDISFLCDLNEVGVWLCCVPVICCAICLWSYDPETTLSDRVEFENERVEFLTEIAALMAAKARLKLNTKKLYASDGRAVQELLKLATILNK